MDAWYDKSASMVINGTLRKCVVICIANVLLPWCNKTRTRDRSHTINGNKISILSLRQSFYNFMHTFVVVFHTYFIHFNTLRSNKLSNVFNSKGFFIYFEMIYYIDFLKLNLSCISFLIAIILRKIYHSPLRSLKLLQNCHLQHIAHA